MGEALITRRGGGGFDVFEAQRAGHLQLQDCDRTTLSAGSTITVNLALYNGSASSRSAVATYKTVPWVAMWFPLTASANGISNVRFSFCAFWGRRTKTIYPGVVKVETEITSELINGEQVWIVRATFTNLTSGNVFVPESYAYVDQITALTLA